MESHLHPKLSASKSTFLSPGFWALISLFIMVFIMGLIKIYSPDLGFHLKSAEWMMENKRFIYNDPFSYGSAEHKYFDLQWLYQLLVYNLYKWNESALVVANALLVTIALILVWFRFVKKTGIHQTSIKMGLFAFVTAIFVQPLTFEVRPYVISWIFLNLTLIVLESYKKGNRKSLVFLPLIMLLWINTHSLAILGLVTIAVYYAGIYLETKKADKTLLRYAVLSLVATFINPYFIDGFLYPLSQFGILSGNSLFKAYLGELRSPFTIKEIEMLGASYFTNPLLIIHLSAIFSIVCIRRAVLQKQFTDALVLAAYLVLLYLAHRNYGVFILVSLPLFVKYFIDWLDRRNQGVKQKTVIADKKKNKVREEPKIAIAARSYQKLYKRLSLATILIAIFISITTITDSYPIFKHSPFRFGFTTDKDQLPVEATSFLNRNQLKGKLLNHLDFGGYLMAHYREKVFIDSRMDQYEEDFFKKYYESLTINNGIQTLLSEHNPDIVIFPYLKASYWWAYFISKGKQAGYKAVYFDGLSVIYVKSPAYPELRELDEKDILSAIDPTADGRINQYMETEKPKGFVVWIKGLWQKQSFSIADQNKASYCFTNGFDKAGLAYSVSGIENSTIHTPNIYKNLSIYYMGRKMYNEAQWCEDRSE